MELGNNVLVGGGKQRAKLWDWTQQYPKVARVLQAGFSLELLPPAVSKEGDLPAAQPGSIQIAAFQSHWCWFPYSLGCRVLLGWDAHQVLCPASSVLFYQASWETNEVMASCKQQAPFSLAGLWGLAALLQPFYLLRQAIAGSGLSQKKKKTGFPRASHCLDLSCPSVQPPGGGGWVGTRKFCSPGLAFLGCWEVQLWGVSG